MAGCSRNDRDRLSILVNRIPHFRDLRRPFRLLRTRDLGRRNYRTVCWQLLAFIVGRLVMRGLTDNLALIPTVHLERTGAMMSSRVF